MPTKCLLDPRRGELRLKDWTSTEAQRAGVTPEAIVARIKNGRYPSLKVRRLNKRVVFVRP